MTIKSTAVSWPCLVTSLSPSLFGGMRVVFASLTQVYNEIQSWETLNSLLVEALNDYNEENAKMDLVLFEDAMSHVCRVSRIIEQPQGNALLVGVGGSGKQSLSRLAAYISGYTIVQIVISRTYGISDLKEDLMKMYRMVCEKNVQYHDSGEY